MSADKPGFTPGPWTTVAGSVFTETDIPRCYEIVHGMHLTRSGTDYQRMSDARLIAAAPDLYEALKDCVERMERAKAILRGNGDGWNILDTQHALVALAKARGEA